MDAWYSVLSMVFGYLSALMILAIVLSAMRKTLTDHRTYRRVAREKRQIAYAGELTVRTGGTKKLAAGTVLYIPYEGTLGAAPGCDVVLSVRRLHLRSAFFWVDGNRMHLVPIQRDAIQVDGETLKPGDEAEMLNGAVLTVNGIGMELRIYEDHPGTREKMEDPYVTRARRAQVHKGRGKGIGSIGTAGSKKSRRQKAAENKTQDEA
ncbi:MAG: hypothetical protein IJ242_06005 [Clostridia bacterium]|nr:hypothetical protein [Clostridia bacterium]